MKAAVVAEFNTPWQIRELPDVRPAAGQVVIQVRASGMCGTDIHVHRGLFPLAPPFVAGHEATGEIVEVGPGVHDFSVGDRVGVFWNQKGCGRCAICHAGRPDRCAEVQTWMHTGGGNSALMVAWASGCALLPDGVSFEDAAPIFCAGYTVMSGLRNASPAPGERVAVLGAGGLGHLAIQFAKALGLETLALTGQADKRQELKGLGADEVVIAGDDPGAGLHAAGGADIVLSTTNSARHISAAFRGLRPGGRFINMGLADGPVTIDPMVLMFGQRELRGSTQDERADLREALVHVARGRVKPLIETYPLERVNAARERLESGKARYRVVLQHATWCRPRAGRDPLGGEVGGLRCRSNLSRMTRAGTVSLVEANAEWLRKPRPCVRSLTQRSRARTAALGRAGVELAPSVVQTPTSQLGRARISGSRLP